MDFEEFRVIVAKQTLSRELRAMGYRKLSARPRHHAQADGAIEDFKKVFPARLEEIGREKGVDPGAIEIWFADEARIGQKNKITRRWAKRGTRPARRTTSEPPRPTSSARSARRTARARRSSCPLQHRGDEPASGRNRHRRSRPAHTPCCSSIRPVGICRAGSTVPSNITLVPLPAKCPELNPQENVWQFMRDNWLSNRVFKSYDDVVDHCCDAWNKLVDQPWRIMSIGLRDWAQGF